eukprot:1162113-Pelagomonas_calceolata.AAC.6
MRLVGMAKSKLSFRSMFGIHNILTATVMLTKPVKRLLPGIDAELLGTNQQGVSGNTIKTLEQGQAAGIA